MGKAWYKLFYHLTWATYLRAPIITPDIERELFPFLKSRALQKGCYVYECNGIEDHVHVAIRIPPRYSISEIVGFLKGSSSHYLNNEICLTRNFAWQRGYSAVSVSESALPNVVRYIRRQKEHHRSHTSRRDLEPPEGG